MGDYVLKLAVIAQVVLAVGCSPATELDEQSEADAEGEVAVLTQELGEDGGVPPPTGFVEGFEGQTTSYVSAPWQLYGLGGIDRGTYQRSGVNNAWVGGLNGWNKIYRIVSVQPNANYRLTGWIRSSPYNYGGFFGARLPNGGAILNEQWFGYYLYYNQVTVDFNAGPNAQLEIYGGVWGHPYFTWAQLDDLKLERR